jgi:hypothetical protein
MTLYCPGCGRKIPDDSKNCAYCGKLISIHDRKIIEEPEQKKDKTVLLIIAIVALLLIVPIIIAGLVFTYVTNMGPSVETSDETPLISFTSSESNITIVATESFVQWSEITIIGTYKTKPINYYITVGDQILGCSGQITIVYNPTSEILYFHDFEEMF